MGLWLGDGWLKSTKRKESKKTRNTNYNQVFICSNKGSEDYVLSKILAAGLKPTLVKDKTTTKFIVSSSPLYRWIKENFSFGARNKTVPYWLVSVCSEYRKAFLDGYFFADGHKYSSSRKATTVSKKVAYGVQMIAYSLGYSSSVFAYNVPPRTVIEGREVNQYGQYQVVVYEKTKRTFRDGYVYGLVRKAENAGTNIVYNIGVEDDESYVADGFVVHNCQDLSVAGKRDGLAGERSGLWYQFHRIIFDIKPRWVIIENVPGLLSSGRSKGLDFAIVLAGLTGRIPQVPNGGWRNSGFMRGRRGRYNIAWRVLDAQHFGVPQRRRRVFIVASLGNGRCAQILFNAESLSGDITESKSTRTDIAGTLGARTSRSSGPQDAAGGHVVVGSIIAHQYKTGGISNHDVKSGHVVVAPEKAKGTRGDYETETFVYQQHGSDIGPMGTLRRGNGSVQGGVPFVFESRIARNGRGAPDTVAPVLKSDSNGDGAPLVFQFQASPSQSMNPSVVSPSLDKSKQPATYQQGSGVRRLTPVEHERLQGFSDGWTAWGVDKSGKIIEISDSQRYKQTGNAVAVPVVEWIAKRLKKEIEEESAPSISYK